MTFEGRNLKVSIITPKKRWYASFKLSNKVWTHVVVTWEDADGLTLYVNGSARDPVRRWKHEAASPNNQFHFGPPVGNGSEKDIIQVDEMLMWNVRKTDAEITALFETYTVHNNINIPSCSLDDSSTQTTPRLPPTTTTTTQATTPAETTRPAMSGTTHTEPSTDERITGGSTVATINVTYPALVEDTTGVNESHHIQRRASGEDDVIATDYVTDELDNEAGDELHENDEQKEELSLNEFLTTTAHNKGDLIYSCRWKGTECSASDFDVTLTDFGVCYTFNLEARSEFAVNESGTSNGLSLIINVEQYEYMVGPRTDAGIKVLLHNQSEVPMVTDIGFAVAPGMHSLVAVKRTEFLSLSKPWGTCSEKELDYFDDYTVSKCMIDCQTRYVVAICHCRAAYMPQKHHNEPRICSLEEYFDCVLPSLQNSTKFMEVNCSCPQPCKKVVYEPRLSYGAISSLSVNKLLDERNIKTTELRNKYHEVLDIVQHVDEEIWETDQHMFENIINDYNQLVDYTIHFYDKDEDNNQPVNEIVYNVQSVIKTYVRDLNLTFARHEEFLSIYSRSYKTTNDTLYEVAHDFLELTRLIFESDGPKLVESLPGLTPTDLSGTIRKNVQQAARKGKDVVDKLLAFREALESGRPLDEQLPDYELSMLPGTIYTSYSSVGGTVDDFLADMWQLLDFYFPNIDEKLNRITSTDSVIPVELTEIFNSFNADVLDKSISKLLQSLNDFYNKIHAMKMWYENSLEEIKHENQTFYERFVLNRNTLYDLAIYTKNITHRKETLGKLYGSYTKSEITKLKLAGGYFSESSINDDILYIENFVSSFKTRVLEELLREITNINEHLTLKYQAILTKLEELQVYYDKKFDYSPKILNIWKTVNALGLIDEKNMNDSVLSEKMAEHFRTSVSADIARFDTGLQENERNLIESLNFAKDRMKLYVAASKMDENFVTTNFLYMDVYFAELSYQKVEQKEAFTWQMLISEIGGFMGLLLGASVLTVFEILDFLLYNGTRKYLNRRGNVNLENGAARGNNNDGANRV
ncbi:unnamed protein product [Owenia fusiformis]|uniref:Uncharacterized protein n=1 Tax=Owenia fusiformis TaxID=6347 RepID=A0A8S4N1M3_OWEFU|nr:unnamed protein product [Owenia fusiformis]